MLDVNKCLGDAEEMMGMTIMHLEDEFAHIRAGKANIRILDDIRVESYGQSVPLNNVSALSTPDARTIAIRPWDKNMIKPIEKAIIDSPVGIIPSNNGEVIRLIIPPLTEERRRDLVKQSGKANESGKISIRNTRRDALDQLKKAIKDGLPEDAEKDAEEKLQKLHDKYIKKADELFAEKEKEIMTI
ncbi:MAG: ribosome recycling factor [Bacteroidaceae bacterium]|nr:ribosome recycling factor [Bacteroidaceae bacterium]